MTGTSSDGLESEAAYGLGVHLAEIQEKSQLIEKLSALSKSNQLPASIASWISLQSGSSITQPSLLQELGKDIESLTASFLSSHQLTVSVLKKHLLSSSTPSRWLLSSDRVSIDPASSAFHALLKSSQKINILVLDTQPASFKTNHHDSLRKELGLYAMTYGGVYVASVSIHANYAGVVRAFQEADAFPGPSVVLAYSPRLMSLSTASEALEILKETKRAIDEGLWPLYRWTPAVVAGRFRGEIAGKPSPATQEDDVFILDSDKLKGEIESFLERSKHLSMIAKSEPVLMGVDKSIEKELELEAERKIQDSFKQLLEGMNSTPVLIL